jgi:hypothetical protein
MATVPAHIQDEHQKGRCAGMNVGIALRKLPKLGLEQKTEPEARWHVCWNVVGTLLGLRFKVPRLVPFIVVAACEIIATGDGLKAIALTILATAVLLQVGYALEAS